MFFNKAKITYNNYQGQEILLYTAPLKYQRKFLHLKKPIDVFGHWAICISGRCYELTRNDQPEPKGRKEKKTFQKYIINCEDEESWLYKKRNHPEVPREPVKHPEPLGHTVQHFTADILEYIAMLVWNTSLQAKYVADENNCQVFIRLFVELIGNKDTQINFPASFDKWVKGAGISRDASFLIFTAGAATVAAGATLMAAPVDPTGTAAAGFAVSATTVLRTSTQLMTDRYTKEKYIQKAQKNLRAQLVMEQIIC